MSAASKKRNRNSRQNRPHAAPSESRGAEAITVAWMVTVLTLVICELFCLAAVAAGWFWPDAGGAGAIVGLSQFCALVLAVVSMALLPVVYRVRRVPPPRAIVVFSVIAAGLPLVGAGWQAWSP